MAIHQPGFLQPAAGVPGLYDVEALSHLTWSTSTSVKHDGTTAPPSLAPELLETLNHLCELPFVDPFELACLVDSRARTAYRRLARLEDAGLALCLRHGTTHARPSSRYLPTADGITLVAQSHDTTPGQLLRRLPVSTQWIRALTARLDSVAAIYRLASAVAVTLGAHSGPLQVLHQRQGPFDALLQLPGEQLVGIVRQGPALERSALTSRLYTLTRVTSGLYPAAVLLVLHSEGDRQHIRRYLLRLTRRGGHNIHNVYMAITPDVAHVATDFPSWRLAYPNSTNYSFRDLTDFVKGTSSTHVPTPHEYHKANIPRKRLQLDRHHTFQLTGAHKRSLDLLLDWPLLTAQHYADLMGFQESRSRHLLAELETQHSLVTRPLGSRKPIRYALSDAGLEYLARRDRSGRPGVMNRWSVETNPLTGQWRGTRVRRLASELAHTNAVHSIVSRLARYAREDPQRYTLRTLDPSHRSRRQFIFNRKRHTIHPDASGSLAYNGTVIPFLLEFERRARHPSKSRQRILPYQAYFSSTYPTQDHSALPLVLVVFDDIGAETQFLLEATASEGRSKVVIPFATTCLDILDEYGALGPAWRIPQSLNYGRGRLADVRISVWDEQAQALLPNRGLKRDPERDQRSLKEVLATSR